MKNAFASLSASVEAVVTRRLAKEATDNLAKGWQTATNTLPTHDTSDR
jgi:hypothetical protein